MDLNAKTERKSTSATDVHVHAHVDARGIALAIIVKLRKGMLMNNWAKLF